MTTERDFDRLARAWLELGPDEAPDRVVAAVLQAAETTPQVRRPTRWPTWRSFPMTRLPIIATVVATLVVVIGGGMLFLGRNQNSVGVPAAPTPSPSVSASPSGAQLPDVLRATWAADVEPIPALGAVDPRPRFVVNTAGDTTWLVTNQVGSTSMYSAPSQVTPGGLALTTTREGAGCAVGAQGRYRWTLSSDGAELALTPVDDACAARATTLGRTWFRALDAPSNGGRGVAAGFDPPFEVTLPAASFDGSYNPDSMDATSTALDRELIVVKDPMGATAPCTADGGGKKPIAKGADPFVAYMRTLPGVTVQTEDLTIDGHRAVRLTVPVSSTVDCPTGKILEWTTQESSSSGWWLIRPGDTDILYLVELPDATYLLQYLGGGVGKDEELQVLSTVHFLDKLATTP